MSGPIIQVAKKLAEQLNINNFLASNGWFDRFKKRNAIVFQVLHGQAASSDIKAAEEFFQKVEKLCENYKPEDIFNCDETGLFWKAPPNKSLVQKYEKSSGIKYSKERITVLLCASANGEKLKPLVIGKSWKPRSFRKFNLEPNKIKKIDKNAKSKPKTPVEWRANKNAWMTSFIFEKWLQQINEQLKSQNRKILLFLDNVSSHTENELSNVKLAFFPLTQQHIHSLWIKELFKILKFFTENILLNILL